MRLQTDVSGYSVGVHPDSVKKLLTMQVPRLPLPVAFFWFAFFGRCHSLFAAGPSPSPLNPETDDTNGRCGGAQVTQTASDSPTTIRAVLLPQYGRQYVLLRHVRAH